MLKFIKKKIRIILGKDLNIKRLKKNGLSIGKNFSFGSYCFIDPSHCFLINIGNNVTFSSNVHILAHDASTKKIINYTKISSTKIKDNVFIGAYTIVLPGITIGENSIVGAGSVVTKNVNDNEVWAGNPARFICTIEEYIKKYEKIDNSLIFDEKYIITNKLSIDKMNEMKRKLTNKIGLIK